MNQNRIKIAIISPGYKPVPAVRGGAIETLITYLIDSNETKNFYSIDLYTIYDKNIEESKYKNTNIIMYKKNSFLNFLYRIINFILKILHINKVVDNTDKIIIKKMNNYKYDKIIVENNMILYKKIYNKYKGNAKFYFHQHNNMYEPGKTQKDATFIAKTAYEIIFVSNAVKKAFNLATKTKKGVTLYNVIDFSRYNANFNKEKSKVRKEINLSKNKYNFIFMGRVCRDKGVKELVEAFNKLNKKYKNISLSIIGFGFGNIKNSYEISIIKKCRNNKNILLSKFLPYNILIKHIIASDCVIIPSIYEEAFGVVALEAMAMKKVIISTKVGGLAETLNDKCAILIEKKDIVNNLYNAMEEVIINPNIAKKLSEEAYKRVHEIKEFDKINYFDNFAKIIK